MTRKSILKFNVMKMEYNSHKALQLRVTTPVSKRGVLKAGHREDTYLKGTRFLKVRLFKHKKRKRQNKNDIDDRYDDGGHH